MRRLVIWEVMTLDGCIEGPAPWSLDFHATVWCDELEAFSLKQLDEVGTLLMGRRTFEGMADYWSGKAGAIADRMNAVEKIAATRRGTSKTWSNARALTGDIADHIQDLKAEDGKDIFVFGSADLTATLLKTGDVDEIRLCLAPVILGVGKPLFQPDGKRCGFELIQANAISSGGVLLRYEKLDR